MDTILRKEILNDAKEWIYEAGDLIRSEMKHPYVINTKKNRKDLVTEIDEKTEQFLYTKINNKYPDHLVLGEEGKGNQIESLNGIIWFVDPIDGTMNFVNQQRFFAISIGIYHNGVGEIGLIYDVVGDILYEGIRGEGAYKNGQKLQPLSKEKTLKDSLIGINSFWSTPNRRVDEKNIHKLIKEVKGTRSYGSAALEFAFVSEGIMDAYITMRLQPWDIAAGMVLLNEVGGITSRADGKEVNLLTGNSIVCCNPAIHSSLLSFIKLKEG